MLCRRRGALGLTVVVVGLLFAPASLEAGNPAALQFSHLPGRAIAGQAVSVTVSRARAGALCSLAVSYAKAAGQSGLQPKTAVDGLASWAWTIPDSIQANVAKLSVACAGSKRISGRLLVVGGLIPPRISIEKDGFTVKAAGYGTGTDVSYGIIVRNHSPNADALNVNVLVNFVLSNDHLLGSTSTTIPVIAAGSSYALGNSFGFTGAAPIARLETVIQVGSSQRHAGHSPALDNIVIEPGLNDKAWVGDVAGEVINNDPSLTLQTTQYSAVILDSAGNVLGGGGGSTYGALPPGTRMVFRLSSGGFTDIPVEKAASVLISTSPTWQRPAA